MRKRILSLLLAGGMVISSVTVPGGLQVKAAEGDPKPVAHYSFDGNFQDSVNTGTVGTVEGSNPPSFMEDKERGQVMTAKDGASGRVKTSNPLHGKALTDTGFTVSAWVDVNAVNAWNGIWSFSSGNSNQDGFYGQATNGRVYYNDNPSNPSYQDMSQFDGMLTAESGWELMTVVMDQNQIHMYKNGALAKEITPKTNTGEGALEMLKYIAETKYLWFGTAGPHYWNSGDFQMDEFKVYDAALTEEQVQTEYLSDAVTAKKIVKADADKLSVPESTLQDLELPTSGNSGYTTISWESSNPDVITDDGKVTRSDADKEVTLTAKVSLSNQTETREFAVKVPKKNPNDDLTFYKEQLVLEVGYVSENLELPQTSGEAKVTWKTSDAGAITKDGVVTRTDENQEVTLTATLSLDGAADQTKEFKLVVLAKGTDFVSYVSNAPIEGQQGGMKLAAANEEEGYTSLHKNQPIMYTTKGDKAYVSPFIFRKADGTSFGMIAADGGNNGKIFLYDSTDLITYMNEKEATLPGIANIAKLDCVYNMSEGNYKLHVENKAGKCFELTTKDFETFSEAEATEYKFEQPDGAPEDAVWASEVALTQKEAEKVTGKFTNPYNTSVSNIEKEITVEPGDDIEAALKKTVDKVTATYSNGDKKTYSVRWNDADLAKADSNKAGMEYTIRGTIGGSAYYTDAEEPLIEERADPCIAYDEERDKYYFTASYPVNGKGGEDGYDRLVIREADTIEGLADAEEHVIWDESEVQGYGRWIWAPELHKIGDSWYFISTAGLEEGGNNFNIRPFMMKCNNAEDITNPDSWGEPVRVKTKAGDSTGLNAMSLDMTYFEAGGKHYLVWADFTRNTANPNGVSSLYIAQINPENPTQLITNCSVIAVPEYSWEVVRYVVNEGPAVIQKDGKVYLAFSASGTGSEYCVGLLTGNAKDDLTDPKNWTKTPYPIMTSGDFNDELCGPGHNSFTVDEYGNPVIVYHARPTEEHAGHSGDPLYDACRHAYVKPVFFDSEGAPILNLSDEEFAKGGSEIKVTVKVKGEAQEATPVLEYNFDEKYEDGVAKDSAGENDAKLTEGASYVKDDEYGQVLYLDGNENEGGHNSYLEFPEGFFDGKDKLTISMDMNEVTRTGNYFTFGIGQDNQKYMFLKTEPTYTKLAITTTSYKGEETADRNAVYPNNSRKWMNIKMVVTPVSISLYQDGELIAENNHTGISISDLGENLKAYIGKSFYDGDKYFRGYFDNVKVYDWAMTDAQIKEVTQQEEQERKASMENVERVASEFFIPNADNIKGNITLPDEKDGVTINWKSSNEEVINTKVVKNAGYDDTPAGVVTRQDKDTKVTLTAEFAKKGEKSITKEYPVTVKAAPEPIKAEDYKGYLFTHFVDQQEDSSKEQVYFSISEDGLNWQELNDRTPVLTSTIGESGVRDHYIMRSPEGDKFYMIATDLSINRNKSGNDERWWAAGSAGSHSIVVWESEDLVNWSEPRLAEIATDNAGCTWAPEFIYDEKTGEYVVYWSSTTLEVDGDENVTQEYENHKIYYAKTRDFYTFTEPKVYHEGGVGEDGKIVKVIDSTMIQDKDTYYRYTKNESKGIIEVDKSNEVLGQFEQVPSESLTNLIKTQGAVEGPIIYKLNEKTADGKDQWCLLVDRFAKAQGYYPLITTDLSSGEFTELPASEYHLPDHARHGYVMPITDKEYSALQRKWGAADYLDTYKLEQTIKTAKAIEADGYTEESYAALQEAIKVAEDALQTVTTTAEADAAAEALQTAIDALVREEEAVLESLTVIPPKKLEYQKGEELDLTGMKVTAVYSDGTEKDVTELVELSGYDKEKTGTQTILVTYEEQSASFEVTVKEQTSGKPDTPEGEIPNGDNGQTSGGTTPKGQETKAARTGDAAQTGMLMLLILLAGGTVIGLTLRKSTRK